MGKGAKGINLTFIFILVLVLVLVWASTNSGSSGSYTKGQFIADMEAGLVVDVEIHPNVQVPTGMLRITLKDGDQRNLYVSDVVEMQEVVTSYRIDPIVKDVPQENWFITELLPLLMLLVVVVFMFSMMNAQNAGNSGGGKMMNWQEQGASDNGR